MGKLLTNIEQEEKNRILEMYGIKKNLISEQLDPMPQANSTIKYRVQGGRITYTGIILSTRGNLLKIKKTSPGSEVIDTFERVDRKTMRLGGAKFDVLSVTPPTTPRRTSPPPPRTVPLPKELVNQRINFFLCPDYDPNLSQKALDSILISKLEEVYPDDDIVGKSMEDRVGSFIKLTTNRKLKGGSPLILYFICGYEGFATNHDGYPIDDFNVLSTKFEGGRYAEKCNPRELEPIKDKAASDTQKRKTDVINQTPKLPTPDSRPLSPAPLQENNNPDGIPTRVFSNTLHNFLTEKYCGKSWSQNRPEDDTTGNV